jgi:hypothetical protein
MDNIFIQASRLKLRFTSTKGLISAEDLWTLPLTNLDDMASALDAEIEKAGKKSRLNVATKATDAETKLAIIEFVIKTRQEEAAAKKLSVQKSAERETLKELLANKRGDKLKDLTEEELMKRLAELED